MRNFIRAALIEALGQPTTRFKSQDDRDWWVVSRTGHADMHICVAGESTAQVAIVLVFDPRNHREPVTTYSARTPAEGMEVIARIAGLTLDRLPAPGRIAPAPAPPPAPATPTSGLGKKNLRGGSGGAVSPA